jgi:hypothetical protein
VTAQAERAHVGEIALASALGYRHDVVGIPNMPPSAPFLLKALAGGVIQLAFVLAQGFRIDTALPTDAPVTGENLFAQIAGVRAQPPLVDAGRAAESEPSARNGRAAPPAQTTFPLDPTAGLGAARRHTRSS